MLGTRFSHRQTEATTEQSEQQAFCKELPNQPRPGCPEGQSHSDLPLSRCRPGKQKIGCIGAGDQKHHADCSKQHQQDSPAGTDNFQIERIDQDLPVRTSVAMLASDLYHQRVQLRLGLLRRHTIFQSPDAFDVMGPALRWIAFERERAPQIDIVAVGH